MAEIVNLRLARKAQKRAKGEQTASVNRAKFGETKAERQKRQAEERREARQLDGARRDPD